MSIWNEPHLLPDISEDARISLGEGQTPLVRSRRIGPAVGLERLFFNLESTNPTGSYKDRFAAAAVSDLMARNVGVCLATSSGNAGAALAAYSAAAGVPCYVAVMDCVPPSKLRQMLAYGARVFAVRGFGVEVDVTRSVLDRLAQLAANRKTTLQISAYCHAPIGMRGVETLGHELEQKCPNTIDHVFCPAGGGGLTLAVARGLDDAGRRNGRPRPVAVECVQPEGNDTIAGPLRRGESRARPINSTTRVSGLQVSAVLDGDAVISACRASGGTGHLVSDEQVFGAQTRLAREEGIFAEPAGAVAPAGALAALEAGYLRSDATVVCLVTSTGFKDEPAIERMVGQHHIPCLEHVAEIDAWLDEQLNR